MPAAVDPAIRRLIANIDVATVAIAELAAARDGLSTAEWIARAARREVARTGGGPEYAEAAEADLLAEHAGA